MILHSSAERQSLEEVKDLRKLVKMRNWDIFFEKLAGAPQLVDAFDQSHSCAPGHDSWAPIHYLSAFGPLHCLARLVEEFKADMKLLTKEGRTPLEVAQTYGIDDDSRNNQAIVDYILQWDTQKDAISQACIEICHLASEARWPEVLKRLSESPKLMDMRPKDSNFSVFHHAAWHGNIEMLHTFVDDFSARIDMKTKDGKTAFEIARDRGHTDIAEYLGAVKPYMMLGDPEIPFPPNHYVKITDTAILSQLEKIMTATIKPPPRNFTRDRGRYGTPVPISYELVGAMRSENVAMWRVYTIQREIIQSKKHEVETVWQPWTKCGPFGKPDLSLFDLREPINEWLLFHGTSPDACTSIARKGFSMSKVGMGATKDWNGALPLYGYGGYFSDSFTKADEYSREKVTEGEFKGCRTVALCRVLGGKYLYCGDDSLDKRTLHERILNGPCDSTVGDRLRLRGSFHEYIIYDASSAYMEYILYFKRKYKPQDIPRVSPENRD